MRPIHPKNVVRAKYPEARAVSWYSGTNAWQIWKDGRPFQVKELGRGETERRAWQNAARALRAALSAESQTAREVAA